MRRILRTRVPRTLRSGMSSASFWRRCLRANAWHLRRRLIRMQMPSYGKGVRGCNTETTQTASIGRRRTFIDDAECWPASISASNTTRRILSHCSSFCPVRCESGQASTQWYRRANCGSVEQRPSQEWLASRIRSRGQIRAGCSELQHVSQLEHPLTTSSSTTLCSQDLTTGRSRIASCCSDSMQIAFHSSH